MNMERSDLFSYFKKKSKLAEFNVLVERKIWDGKDPFITKDGVISIGLWKEIYNFCEVFGYDCEIDGINECLDLNFNKERYLKYVELLLSETYDEFGNQISARDYQIEGAYRALRYKFCTEELATSAGKTLLFYIYNSYLRDSKQLDSNNKALLIVPNVSLVTQTAEKFELYSKNKKRKWKVHTIGGDDKFDQKAFEECEILITTYQSLINMTPIILSKRLDDLIRKKVKKGEEDKNKAEIERVKENLKRFSEYDLFKWFKVVNIDETHKSRGASISDIIKSCKRAQFKLGLSGTVKLDEQYSDFFKMQENVGPLVMILEAKHLIDNGYSPNVIIKMLYLQYDESDPFLVKYKQLKENGKTMYKNLKDYGRDMSQLEKKFIIESSDRLEFISSFINKLGKNTLILFSDVKNEYGQDICNKLKEWNPHTFYIDGSIKASVRDEYKNLMESQNNVIIVASFGTFSTGIDLKNVHHIIFAESTKAEITIRQSIGRGMRKLAEKIKVVIWDLIDDFSGYSVKHSKIREQIYIDQKFEIVKHKIDIKKKSG